MAYIESDFLTAIESSYLKYVEYGSKSPEKLKPIHTFWADVLLAIFGETYKPHYNSKGYRINPDIKYLIGDKKGMPKGEPFKELKVEGEFYDKSVDVSISDNLDNPIFCLGIKFITANYEQNSTNYFESMLGETINIQHKDIPYAHLIIFRKHTPYYQKKDNKIFLKYTEDIKKEYLKKYIKLQNDKKGLKPFAICLFSIDILNEKGELIIHDFEENCQIPKCVKIDLGNIEEDLAELSVEKFLEKIQLKANQINGIID